LSPNFDSVDNPYDDIGKTYGVVLLYQINCYLQQLRYSCYRRVERVGQDHIYGLGWGYAGGVGANVRITMGPRGRRENTFKNK